MADPTELQKKAFDFAADLTKQLIGLSTSIVTVTLLFGKDLPRHSRLALSAWILFLLSTLCGLWTLMGLTGTLAARVKASAESESEAASETSEFGWNIRFPSGLQIVFFALAILCTLFFVCRWY